MHLDCGPCVIRSWRWEDAEAIARHANNRKIWLALRDRFPHPYTRADADQFLRLVTAARPETHFAIAVGDEAVGAIGFVIGTDIACCSAELGYWLAESVWGRGIGTAAVRALTRYAMATHGLTRVFAVPFSHNPASCRVLEKAGYVREGAMRRSAVKDGQVKDQVLYAYTADECPECGLPLIEPALGPPPRARCRELRTHRKRCGGWFTAEADGG